MKKISFIDYPKPKRIPIKDIKPIGKELMGAKDVAFLLSGKVLIEEKMDGSPVSFIVNNRFVIWAEDMRICHSIKYKIPGRYFIFDIYDTKTEHVIGRDDKLEIVWDIRSGKLPVQLNIESAKSGALPTRKSQVPPIMFVPVAEVTRGHFEIGELYGLIGVSEYAYESIDNINIPSFMEGIVVKQDRPLFLAEMDYSHGKVVREEFIDGIDINYIKRRVQEYNIIDPSIKIIEKY